MQLHYCFSHDKSQSLRSTVTLWSELPSCVKDSNATFFFPSPSLLSNLCSQYIRKMEQDPQKPLHLLSFRAPFSEAVRCFPADVWSLESWMAFPVLSFVSLTTLLCFLQTSCLINHTLGCSSSMCPLFTIKGTEEVTSQLYTKWCMNKNSCVWAGGQKASGDPSNLWISKTRSIYSGMGNRLLTGALDAHFITEDR